MDKQSNPSSFNIDHRKIATHSVSGVFGLILGMLFGINLPHTVENDPDKDLVQIESTALDRGVDFWAAHLEPSRWRPPHVVLIDYDRGESTPCGLASKTSGPFYCPRNERIYLDLSFLRVIRGDLARAYVVAHELAHHIQKLRNELRPNRDSVAIELQADCWAGLWMRDEQSHNHLASGDIDAALSEAAAVGDDRLAPDHPEIWRHGTSEQRAAKLREGFAGGPCNE